MAGRVLLLVATLLLALSAPVAAIRFISFFVFLLLGIGLLYAAVIQRMIGVRRLDPEIRGARFQTIPSRLLVSNRLPVPIPRILVSETPNLLGSDGRTREVTLAPSAEVEVSFELHSDRRGEYRFGPVRLSGNDPFGFSRWEREDGSTGRAIVYPRIYSLELRDPRGTAGGSTSSTDPSYEDVTRFRSLREYVRGDDLRRINWKASARGGRLLTTEYERTITAALRVVLSLAADDYGSRRRDQLTERAIEVAAATAFSCAWLGQPVGLLAAAELPEEERSAGAAAGRERGSAFPVVFPEGSGWDHAEQILELLARLRVCSGSADYATLLSSATAGRSAGLRVVLIAPEPNAEQGAQLRALRARHVRMELLIVRLEDAAPAETSRELEGVLPVRYVTSMGEQLLDR